MRPSAYYMLSFATMHDAMKAEKRLSSFFPVSVMPTLRAVTHSCGISLRIEDAHLSPLLDALPDIGLEREAYALYRVDEVGVHRKDTP